jgi:hypothetical protein
VSIAARAAIRIGCAVLLAGAGLTATPASAQTNGDPETIGRCMATFEFFGSLATRMLGDQPLAEFDRGVFEAALADAEEYWTRARDDLKRADEQAVAAASLSYSEVEERYVAIAAGTGGTVNPNEHMLAVWSCGDELGYAE